MYILNYYHELMSIGTQVNGIHWLWHIQVFQNRIKPITEKANLHCK
jgi:hypothetical protein